MACSTLRNGLYCKDTAKPSPGLDCSAVSSLASSPSLDPPPCPRFTQCLSTYSFSTLVEHPHHWALDLDPAFFSSLHDWFGSRPKILQPTGITWGSRATAGGPWCTGRQFWGFGFSRWNSRIFSRSRWNLPSLSGHHVIGLKAVTRGTGYVEYVCVKNVW